MSLLFLFADKPGRATSIVSFHHLLKLLIGIITTLLKIRIRNFLLWPFMTNPFFFGFLSHGLLIIHIMHELFEQLIFHLFTKTLVLQLVS